MARDPAAVALRDRVVRAYRDLRGIHEKVTQRQWSGSPENALTVEIELRYRKPNRLYLAIDYPQIGTDGRWQLVYACDGKTMVLYNSARNEYQTLKSPATLYRLVLPATLRGPEFIALLRGISPFEEFEKSAAARYSEAFELTDAGPRHTLKVDLQQDGARRTLQYRVGAGDNLIHGLTLSIVPSTDAVSPFADPEVRSRVEATYTLVEANPRFGDSEFRFTPPPGSRERKPEAADESTRPGAPARKAPR